MTIFDKPKVSNAPIRSITIEKAIFEDKHCCDVKVVHTDGIVTIHPTGLYVLENFAWEEAISIQKRLASSVQRYEDKS